MIGIWLTLDFRWVLMIHHLFKICTYANIMQISHPWHGFHIILHCDISFQHVLRALPSKWTRKTHWLQWSALGCSGESSSTERASRPPKNHIRLPGQMRMNQKSRHPAIWSIYLFLHDIYIQLKNGKIDIDIAIIFGSQSNISIFLRIESIYYIYYYFSIYSSHCSYQVVVCEITLVIPNSPSEIRSDARSRPCDTQWRAVKGCCHFWGEFIGRYVH